MVYKVLKIYNRNKKDYLYRLKEGISFLKLKYTYYIQ